MQYLSKFLWITIFYWVVACAEKEPELDEFDPEKHCSFKLSVEYNLNKNPSQDFIAENVTAIATISESTCSGIFDGQMPASAVKYVTRAHNTLSLSSGINSFDEYVGNLDVSGTTITPKTLTHCEYDDRMIESITSASLNVSDMKLNINATYTLDADACTGSYVDPDLYEHTEIRGLWEEPCSSGTQHWRSYSANAAIDTIDYYSNANCTGSLMYIEMNGPTFLGTESAYPKSITTSYQNYFVYLYDASLASSFNSLSMCGITTWTTGVDIDVKGRFCDFAANGIRSSMTFPSGALKHFDIFSKSASVLRFGDWTAGV